MSESESRSNQEYVPSSQETEPWVSESAETQSADAAIEKQVAGRDTYDLSKAVDNPMVKKYQPRFLAKGGEHIIYDVPGHPDIVVKVEKAVMARIQRYNAEHGQPLDHMDPEELLRVQALLKKNQESVATMKKHFGAEHTLNIKQALVKVPTTENIIRQLHIDPPDELIKGVKEAWAIVRVQKRAPEFADPSRKSVVAGYAESTKPDPELYGRVTSALVEGDPKAEYTPEEYRSLLPKAFGELLETAEKDEQLAATLRDFVEKTIAYSEETGEILDLAGGDNVTVFKKDGKWNYRLVDALYPSGFEPKPMLERARNVIEKSARGEEADGREKNVIYNAVNFVRVINGMARQLGIGKQITLAPETSRGKVGYLKLLTPPEKKKE